MLFNKKEIKRTLSDLPLVQRCVACGITPNPLKPEGEGKAGILVVFGRPNLIQWENRSWFADTNQNVFQGAYHNGRDPQKDYFVTGVLLCRGEGDQTKYEQCLSCLNDTVRKFNPTVIITVGELATGAVLRLYNPLHYRQDNHSAELFGHCIPLNQEPGWNCWLAPVMDQERFARYVSADVNAVAVSWFYKHIMWAFGLSQGRPPKYQKPRIEILLEPDQIVQAIDQAIKSELTAFDYETTALEPWRKKAEILTCSIGMGTREKLERTVAFPMNSKEVREKWVEYLRSPVCKIGANNLFEHYWSAVYLSTPTINWTWDTCLGARILDCSPGVSGLKRTTFVTLGIIGYDDTVDPYMKTENADGTNDLKKMNPTDLLTYNAYDSAYTYECALRQRKLLKVEF